MNLHEACVKKGTDLQQLSADSGVSYPRLNLVSSGVIELLEEEKTRIEAMLDAVGEIDWEKMFGKREIYSLLVSRLARSLTQQVLAENSKVNQARISQCERGDLRLNTGEKERIEQVLNTKIFWEENIMETNEMPAMEMGKTNDNPIEAVQNHLEAKHGKAEAAAKLKAMSAADLITLADNIASGTVDNEQNDMPKMHITNAVKN